MELPSRRAMALLVYVACVPDAVPRTVLASMFWPDSDTPAARGNLRSVLSHLRRLDGLLTITRTTVRLNPGAAAQVDVRRFDALADRALRRARVADATDRLEQAWGAWGGELLSGLDLELDGPFSRWLTAERTRLRLRAVQVLDALVDAHLAAGATRRTVALATQLLMLDPYREGSLARLMRALWCVGESTEALRRYNDTVELLAADLDSPISDELRDLADRIRDGRRPPPQVTAPKASTLPPRPELVGRNDDRVRLEGAIGRGGIITLTGPGGVGKTSLALGVAHRAAKGRPGSVTYVDLLDIEETAAVEQLCASIWSDTRSDQPAAPASPRSRVGLLVLDNFEHVLPAAPAVTTLRNACPDLTILITSRTPLRIRGEQVVTLAPLDTVAQPGADRSAHSPAVQMFLDRADKAGVHLARTDQTIEQVAAVCRLVDGLPLGIELAAARLRMLGLADLVEALDTSAHGTLDVLGRGRVDGPRHHRTVRDAIAWSHDLLGPISRVVMRRFAVFVGGADLAAVQAVCTGDDVRPDEVVDALVELVDLNLVTPAASSGTRARFRMLVTTHAYASDLLRAAGDGAAARKRHADHYTDRAGAELDDAKGTSWLDRVADLANHAAASRHLIGRGEYERARRHLADLGPAFRRSGRTGTGRLLHDAARHGPEGDPVLTAECEVWRVGLLAEEHPGRAAPAVSRVVDQTLPVLRGADLRRRARVLSEAVQVLSYVGKGDQAIELANELRGLAVTPLERRWELGARWETAWIAHRRGNDGHVSAILADLIPAAIEAGNRRVELYGWMLAELAGTDRSGLTPDPDGLHGLFDMAIEVNDRRYATWLLVSLGAVATIEKRLTDAVVHFRHALRLATDLDYETGFGLCLLGVVAIRAFSGDLATAVRLHASLEPHLPSLHHVLPRAYREAYEAVITTLTHRAGADAALDLAWRDGARLTLREATDQARHLLEGPHSVSRETA